MDKFLINRHSLDLALNFDFSKSTKFELYRRKDNRSFRFIRYDGKNYDELYEFLQDKDNSVLIPPSKRLYPGKLYNVNGKNKFQAISEGVLNSIIAANNYLVRGENCYNMLFNYEVSHYLLSSYANIKLKVSSQVNNNDKSPVYTTTEELEKIPQDSYLRTHRVWFVSAKESDINIAKIPTNVIESYLSSEDYYQEFETFEKEGKIGLIAWKSDEIVPPVYKNILIENYRAYLQNEEGYWAEYGLKANKFKSDFIYSEVQVDATKGFVTAQVGERQVILHGPHSKEDNLICKDENGLYGVKRGKTWIIPAIYDFISLWKDSDRFEVYKEGKYGLFSGDGYCILSCKYDSLDATSSDMEVFKVCVDDKWGVVSSGDITLYECTLDDGDSEILESEYFNSINQMINQMYKHHKFLRLQLLKRNVDGGYIVMRIVGFNRIFKIYRNYLPEQIFDKCMSSYWEAVNTLKKLAIRVDEKGRIIIDYPETLKWLDYRQKVYALKPQMTVTGIVYSINRNKVIVKLENGLFGEIVGVATDKYVIGKQLQLVVEQVKNIKVILREVEACVDVED
ncbi:hypothetical protein [uncultured Parabacteroides sp.]|uniref:hypothetical protein n=2 Tax=uncultured Parabacteroides sp. TaxID=512312 RepID=UPI0025D9592A|nr:hypothetical protein [uncultured Parabacteroides sp.]